MTQQYTRAAVLLRWNSGGSSKAFKVQVANWAGDDTTRPGTYNHGVYDGGLLRVLGDEKHRFVASLFAPYTAETGSVGGVNYGSLSDLLSASRSTDLQVKGPGDSDYWDAHWKSDWAPRPIDPMGKLFTMPVEIIGR